MNWWKLLLIILVVIGGIWVFRYVTTPPPGVEVADQGRKHVTPEEVAKTVYNSNPPTSGQHLEAWVKPGVYEEPQREGELIHSLEHGYVNISYNCNPVLAGINDATPSGLMQSASNGATNDSDACKTLVKQLTDVAKKKKLFKLLVVPRPQLDVRIALTAWGHIDKFNDFDAKRIEAFIDYWRDHGPEQTME